MGAYAGDVSKALVVTCPLFRTEAGDVCSNAGTSIDMESSDAAMATSDQHRRNLSVEPTSLQYLGPVRVCDSCDCPSNGLNPLYMCRFLPIKFTIQYTKKFRPWCRYDPTGFCVGRVCLLCAWFAERAYRRQGGRKYLSSCKSGALKATFKSNLESFIVRMLAGEISIFDEENLISVSVSTSTSSSLVVEKAWDFCTVAFLTRTATAHEDSDLVDFVDETDGITHRGVWKPATGMFPPQDCLRVVSRGGTKAERRSILDDSRLAARDGQLEDSYQQARSDATAWSSKRVAQVEPGNEPSSSKQDNSDVGSKTPRKRKPPSQEDLSASPGKPRPEGSDASSLSGARVQGADHIAPNTNQGSRNATSGGGLRRACSRSALLPPSKHRRAVDAIENTVGQGERLLAAFSELDAINACKVSAVVAVQKRLEKSEQSGSQLERTNSEHLRELTSKALQRVVILTPKLLALKAVAHSLHAPREEEESSALSLQSVVLQYHGVVQEVVPRCVFREILPRVVA